MGRQYTRSQYVYAVWLDEMRALSTMEYSSAKTTRNTAKKLQLPEEEVSRIVHIQSRWTARRILKKAKGKL